MKKVRKIFQYYLNSDDLTRYIRVIPDHSGENQVDPSLQDNVEIPYNWYEYLYDVGSSLDLHSTIYSGLIAGGKGGEEGRQIVSFTVVNPMTDSQDEESYDVGKPRKVPCKTLWKVYQDAVHTGSIWKALKIKDWYSDKSDSTLLSFMTLFQSTVLKKWWIPKLKRFLYQKFPYHVWGIILKDVWQVQREDYHQCGTSTERIVTDEDEMDSEIYFSIQAIPHSAVEQDEDNRIRLIKRLVHQVKNHPSKDALIAGLQYNRTYSSFVKNQRRWFMIWGTWNASSCARSLPKSSVHNYWSTGLKKSSTVLVWHTWLPQTTQDDWPWRNSTH